MNKLKEFRKFRMMSKAELAKQAGLSPMTINRVEQGFPCRLATQRKILAALPIGTREKADL